MSQSRYLEVTPEHLSRFLQGLEDKVTLAKSRLQDLLPRESGNLKQGALATFTSVSQ